MTPKELIQETLPDADPSLPKADLPKPEALKPAEKQPRARQLILGACLGIAFGFLLQKGGVAKYHILIGALLLEDFTVAKVMLSAIVVGMTGVLAMHRLGWIQLQIKPTRYAANVMGGLLFGVGFGLIAYCPGTGAAAIGQGNFDALFGVLGLIGGSYLFAEASGFLDRTINKWGDRGKITLADLVHVRLTVFALVLIPLLLVALFVLERSTVR
jgi:uncharacterized protein